MEKYPCHKGNSETYQYDIEACLQIAGAVKRDGIEANIVAEPDSQASGHRD